MKSKENQNRINITMYPEAGKQKIPLDLIISMVAGTFTGTAIIFVLLMGVKYLFGL